MKVRIGHVSNSSTSSFCGIGVWRECDFEKYEELWERFKDLDAVVCYSDWDESPIGIPFSRMKDNETLAEFKQRAKEQIEKGLGEEAEVEFIERAWHDG